MIRYNNVKRLETLKFTTSLHCCILSQDKGCKLDHCLKCIVSTMMSIAHLVRFTHQKRHYKILSIICYAELKDYIDHNKLCKKCSKFGWQLLNFLATLEHLLGVLSSKFCLIYQHNLFMPIWEPRRKLIAHQCCDQLTAVKTRYPLTSIT